MNFRRLSKNEKEIKKETVIELFYNQHDNSSQTIAEQTNLKISTVNRILTEELKKYEKRNQDQSLDETN